MAAATGAVGGAQASVSAEDLSQLLKELDVARDAERVAVRFASGNDLNDYSILSGVPLERKAALVQAALRSRCLDRAMGSMCGMAVGDALGHLFEFQPVQDAPGAVRFDLATMTAHGASNVFGLQRGQWTDDASMGLCMADSLILRRRFDGSDMRVRFWCWWHRGYNNAFRKDPSRSQSVGLGGNISKSLEAISGRRGRPVPPTYDAPGEDAGNGSLMRFAPVALFLHAAEAGEAHRLARLSSYTTHPGIIAAEACSLLCHIIVRALNLPPTAPVDARTFLDAATADYLEASGLSGRSGWGYDQMKWLVTSSPVNATERCWDWKGEHLDIAGTLRARGSSYNGYPVSAGYFGSYSLDGLALALWAVYHTTSFDEAIVRSVNLLGDADSHGSITGQIAGALYGRSAIGAQFLEWLAQWDDHEFAVRALLLHHSGATRAPEEEAGASPDCGKRKSEMLAPEESDRTTVDPEVVPELAGSTH